MTSVTKAIAAAVATAAIATLPACNILTPAFYILEGPPTIEAAVELDSSRPTVVFIDDRGVGDTMIVPRRSLRRLAGEAAENTLLAERVISDGNMIRSADALRVAANESGTDPLSVVEVGRAVGAEVIIYAEVRSFDVSRDSQYVAPTAELHVTVFDAENNTIIAPEQGVLPVTARMPPTGKELANANRRDLQQAQEALAATIGLNIARLFFEHEPPSRVGRSL